MFIEDGEPLVIYGVHRIRRGKRARYRTPKRDFFCIGYRLSGCADFYLADGNCRHVAEHNAVLIGNEGNGLPSEIVRRCDKKLTIHMNGNVNSLNAATAASIIMWELTK